MAEQQSTQLESTRDRRTWSALRRHRRALLAAAVVVVLSVPLMVALGVLHQPRWFPLLDMAQTELRVRDVASSNPPLIGLAGRLGSYVNQGSHPGPLSFWALWPFYELFGAGGWALEAASAALNVVAIGIAVWFASRRGGTALLLAFGVVLALLTRAYGAELLTQPWNPYLPILFWFAFLVCVWSLFCDDLPALPALVFTGSIAMQTHVSYVGLVGGLGLAAVGVTVWRGYHRRGDPDERRARRRWGLVAVGVGVLVWLPPVIDQLTNSPGNLRILWDYFTNPPESPIGVSDGLHVMFANLDPWRLVANAGSTGFADGSVIPGLLFVGVWAGAAIVAWRRKDQVLGRLHAVIAIALVLGMVSSTRIVGFIWYYLLLWVTGVAALMLLAIGWTIVAEVRRRVDEPTAVQARRVGIVALVVVGLTVTAVFTSEASTVDVPSPRVSATLGALVAPTVHALRDRAGDGRDAATPFLVTWLPDPFDIGSQGYGLLNELERAGLDVKAEDLPITRIASTPHRVLDRAHADTEVHLAIGDEIEKWRAKPEFEEVASSDPYDAKTRAEYRRLRADVIRRLEAAGLDDHLPLVDDNLFVLVFDSRVPKAARDDVTRMVDLGQPAAVFVGPAAAGA